MLLISGCVQHPKPVSLEELERNRARLGNVKAVEIVDFSLSRHDSVMKEIHEYDTRGNEIRYEMLTRLDPQWNRSDWKKIRKVLSRYEDTNVVENQDIMGSDTMIFEYQYDNRGHLRMRSAWELWPRKLIGRMYFGYDSLGFLIVAADLGRDIRKFEFLGDTAQPCLFMHSFVRYEYDFVNHKCTAYDLLSDPSEPSAVQDILFATSEGYLRRGDETYNNNGLEIEYVDQKNVKRRYRYKFNDRGLPSERTVENVDRGLRREYRYTYYK